MKQSINDFFNDLRSNHKKVAFLGTGVTHRGCIRQFTAKGLDVTLCDKRSPEDFGEELRELTAMGVHLCLGEGYLTHLTDYDVILRTPGIRFHLPEIQAARAAGKAVTSELELFFDYCPCPIVAITGSDGKTTTTSILSEFFSRQGRTVHLGGNIGRALLPEVETIRPEDVAVVELSSFQLISMRCSPDISVLTNLSPNHLDMHKDMQEYIDAKRNILLHQNAFGRAVLNLDNEITRAMSADCRGAVIGFSRQNPALENGAFLSEDGTLCYNDYGTVTPVLHRGDILLPGDHNVENYLAAIAAAWGLVTPEVMAEVAKTFQGVEHRVELVRRRDGVRWYNDSIASSPTRTIAGLNAFPQKVILIAGGYDKKIPYEPLAPKLAEKARCLILMGATAPKIEAALAACPDFDPAALPIVHVNTMEEAVAAANAQARDGDIVFFSPASASFDLYRNFEERGNHFKSLVNSL